MLLQVFNCKAVYFQMSQPTFSSLSTECPKVRWQELKVPCLPIDAGISSGRPDAAVAWLRQGRVTAKKIKIHKCPSIPLISSHCHLRSGFNSTKHHATRPQCVTFSSQAVSFLVRHLLPCALFALPLTILQVLARGSSRRAWAWYAPPPWIVRVRATVVQVLTVCSLCSCSRRSESVSAVSRCVLLVTVCKLVTPLTIRPD